MKQRTLTVQLEIQSNQPVAAIQAELKSLLKYATKFIAAQVSRPQVAQPPAAKPTTKRKGFKHAARPDLL